MLAKGNGANREGYYGRTVPMLVPTISRVRGMMATSRIINGTERPKLMMAPNIRFSTLCGRCAAQGKPLANVEVTRFASSQPRAGKLYADEKTRPMWTAACCAKANPGQPQTRRLLGNQRRRTTMPPPSKTLSDGCLACPLLALRFLSL